MMKISRNIRGSILENLRRGIALFLVVLLWIPSPILSETVILRNGKTIPDVTPLEYKENSVVFRLASGRKQEYKKSLLKQITVSPPKKERKKREPGSLKKCLLVALIIPGAGEICSARDTSGGIMLTLGLLAYGALITSATLAGIYHNDFFTPTQKDIEISCRANATCRNNQNLPPLTNEDFDNQQMDISSKRDSLIAGRQAAYASLGILGGFYVISILNTWLGHHHRIKKNKSTSQYDTSIRPFLGIIPNPSGQYEGFAGVQATF